MKRRAANTTCFLMTSAIWLAGNRVLAGAYASFFIKNSYICVVELKRSDLKSKSNIKFSYRSAFLLFDLFMRGIKKRP